jgi:methionyl aminopeptidase
LHQVASGKTANGILDYIRTPKVVSKPDPATGLYNPFPSFDFTGPLRPVYPLSERRTVPKDIPWPDYAETGYPKSERFLNRNKFDILDAEGQEAMRKVCRIGREVLDIVAAEVRPGVTTDYLDEVCHKATIERKVRCAFPEAMICIRHANIS